MPPAGVRVQGPEASQAGRTVSGLQCARGGWGAATGQGTTALGGRGRQWDAVQVP